MPNDILEFDCPQQALEIGNVTIGGEPGINPSVLIGSIFYHGHDVVTDENAGDFDVAAATARIREQEDFSERTGCPGMLDVVGASPQAIERHLEFAADVTDMPLLIDGTTTEVRLAGLKYVEKAGLGDRIVYNSIQPEINDDEFKAIEDAGVTAAILLTYYIMDFTGAGRVQAVRELAPRAQERGIDKLIIDTCVLDLASMGQAMAAMVGIKNEFGLPVGGGVHNAVAVWKGLKTKMGKQAKKPCLASACAAAPAVGANFALYGPIEDAQYVFPAVAMIDTAQSQIAMERDQFPVKTHPRFRVG